MIIRNEEPKDEGAIAIVLAAAFKDHPFSNQREPLLVEALRVAGAMTVSLVAELDGEVVGHIAFSPVTIDGLAGGWLALGPLAVRPDRQGQGIGKVLVRHGLERLRALPALGCVLVGDSAYYGRFGFARAAGLGVAGVPPDYVLVLAFAGSAPEGTVEHHAAFRLVA